MNESSPVEEPLEALLARRDYHAALPRLRTMIERSPSNVRVSFQLGDALAGARFYDEARERYELTARLYDAQNLVVQAIAVRKKAEALPARSVTDEPSQPAEVAADVPDEKVSHSATLSVSPLFEDLSGDERAALAAEMVLVEVGQGDIIITEGEEGSSLYVIVSGEVKVYTKGNRGGHVYLASLREGDFFGEVSIISGKPRTATITAATSVQLLCLEREKFDHLAVTHPRMREVLDEFYRKRVDQTVEAMIENLRKERSG